MQVSIRILVALLISAAMAGCASAPNLKLLEERANYDAGVPKSIDVAGFIDEKGKVVPVRVNSNVVVAWLHPHEMPTGDYFLGSWVSLVVNKPGWEIQKVPLKQ